MDALNQLIEQARTFFASMTPGARLTAGLLLAVVVVSVAFLFQQSTASSDAYLFDAHPLTSAEIVAVEAAFGKAGLSKYEVEGNRIRVPGAMKAEYYAAAVDGGAIPVDVMGHMDDALNGGGMMDSREKTSVRIKVGREKQLSKVISDMAWVTKASVLLGEQKLRGLGNRSRMSATVSVQPRLGEMLDGRRVRTLQRYVAGSHPDLAAGDVTVVDLSDSTSYGGASDPNEFDDPYHKTLVSFENNTRQRVLRQLSYIPGVRVEVNATLDPRIDSRIRSTKPEKDPLVRNTREQTETNTQNTTDGSGRPGLIAQGPQRNGAEGPSRTNQQNVRNTREEQQSVFAATETVEKRAGLVPEEVRASIEVPRDYIVTVYKQRAYEETGEMPETVDQGQLKIVESEVVEDVTTTVKGMLPAPPGAQDEYKFVEVVVFDTVDAPPLPAPSIASEAMFFASKHASTAAMVIMGVVGLLMLRSVVSGAPKGDSTDGVIPSLRLQTPDGESIDASVDNAAEGDENKPKLQLKKPETLKDDLALIVGQDPDAAAAILRGWIGSAS